MKRVSLGLAVFAIAATVHAQIYTSRAVYDLAHPGNYAIDFNSATPAPPQHTDYTATAPWGSSTFDAIPSSNNIEFLGQSNFSFLGANNPRALRIQRRAVSRESAYHDAGQHLQLRSRSR